MHDNPTEFYFFVGTDPKWRPLPVIEIRARGSNSRFLIEAFRRALLADIASNQAKLVDQVLSLPTQYEQFTPHEYVIKFLVSTIRSASMELYLPMVISESYDEVKERHQIRIAFRTIES